MHKNTFTKQDWLAALFVTIFILFIGATTLTTGVPEWGDDFAAYISEGISIADGDFHEQTIKNYTMHPSPLTLEASEEGLIYVWGYPLMLAGIYKLVGFDRVSFSKVIYYKIPLLVSLALLGGTLVLFYRRRFSLKTSIVLAILMCMSGDLFPALNNLYSDLPFLFFSMLTLLLAECFAEKADEKESMWLGIVYGISLWFTYEIRLNGIAVCIVALLGHILALLKNRNTSLKRQLWKHIIPYTIYIILLFITEHCWLAPATSNMSDVGTATPSIILNNIYRYWQMIFDYLDSILGMHLFCLGYILIAAIFIGIVFRGILENLHLSLLLVGTLAVDVMLPYMQGLRYIYNILPLMLMFAFYGIQTVWRRIKTIIKLPWKIEGTNLALIGTLLCVYVLVFPTMNHIKTAMFNLKNWGWKDAQDVYEDQAIDIYNYIQNNVPVEDTIAFGKPRALYLNTNRVSIRPGYNGHRIADADYYLEYQISHGEFLPEKKEATATPMKLVYRNESFKLFKVTAH